MTETEISVNRERRLWGREGVGAQALADLFHSGSAAAQCVGDPV